MSRKAAKISTLISDKFDKYEYFTTESKQIIEQAKLTYSLLGKAFDEQT